MTKISKYAEFNHSNGNRFFDFDYEKIKEFRKFYSDVYREKGAHAAFELSKQMDKSGKVKISDVIKYFEMIKKEEGDLDVRYLKNYGTKKSFIPITEFDVIYGNVFTIRTSPTKGTTTFDIGRD